MKNKKFMLSTVALAALATSAGATIYIAPPDIDAYKQKTDQSFYDLYQNQNSVIAKGANPILKDYANNVSTKNKMFEGNTITNVAQSNVQGINFKAGTHASVKIFGNWYNVTVDDMGNLKLIARDIRDAKYLKNGILVMKTGANAIPITGARCIKKSSVTVGKSSYSYCSQYQREAVEATFNAITGIVTENKDVMISDASPKVIQQGKSVYVKSVNRNNWRPTQTLLSTKQTYDLRSVLAKQDNAVIGIDKRFYKINIGENKISHHHSRSMIQRAQSWVKSWTY